jgi:hypothetical protein
MARGLGGGTLRLQLRYQINERHLTPFRVASGLFCRQQATNPDVFLILRPPQWLRQPVARGCSAPEARRADFLAFAFSRHLVRELHRFSGSGDDGNTLNLNHRVRRNKRVDID